MAILDSVLKGITQIQIESSLTPTIVLDKPFEPGPPNPFMSFLRPKVTLRSNLTKDVVMEPYGKPNDYWPVIKIGLIATGSLLTLGFLSAIGGLNESQSYRGRIKK